jgi:hypothetical protein
LYCLSNVVLCYFNLHGTIKFFIWAFDFVQRNFFKINFLINTKIID